MLFLCCFFCCFFVVSFVVSLLFFFLFFFFFFFFLLLFQVTVKLSDELERAKQELAEVEAQVLRLEKEEKQDAAATTIQSGARMRRAKLEVERQKLAMIQQQQEVERREQELNAHTEIMKGKEAARDEYRQKRLSEQQDRREALLNKKMAERKGNLMRGGATVGLC